MATEDTICALATASGRAGVAVVRVSGDDCDRICRALCGDLPEPRRAALRALVDDDDATIDRGLVLRFPAPASFTGEDVLELHVHGGDMVSDMILQRLLELGCRLARPGEFSLRAFHNDKLDLAQAEAISALVDAGSRQAARAAMRSLSGRFSEAVHALASKLDRLRVHIEAAIDFPEEEIDLLADEALRSRMDETVSAMAELRGRAEQGERLRRGLEVVIVGPPNAGKSSLLNRLAARDAAIVTDVPGTTRDPIRVALDIGGVPVSLVDTAGLHERGDQVERIGMERARAAMDLADLVLVMTEDGGREPEIGVEAPTLRLHNKVDTSGGVAGERSDGVGISAITGAGLDALERAILAHAGAEDPIDDALSARRRHVDALTRTQEALGAADAHLSDGDGELAAEALRRARAALGEIVGTHTNEDLLGDIFSSFCIGK